MCFIYNQSVSQEIKITLHKYIQSILKKEADVAVVGGSDINKIKCQLGEENLFKKYDYIFAENGLVAYKNSEKLPSEVQI
jgi:phosphomannomutase